MKDEQVYQHDFFSTSGVNDSVFKDAGEPPSGYSDKAIPDINTKKCFELKYEKRRNAFIQHALKNPGSNSIKGHYVELIGINEYRGPVFEGKLFAALNYIDERRDCADFVMLCIVRLLYQL